VVRRPGVLRGRVNFAAESIMIKLNRTCAMLVWGALLPGFLPLPAAALAQAPPQGQAAPQPPPAKPSLLPQAAAVQPVTPPSDYLIGTDDVLVILFRREKDMSAEVTVRPDGKITLPLLNDIQATGLTTDQLRDAVVAEARRLVEDPSVTVVVKQINSRKVFITGQVGKPGAYAIGSRLNVMQLIAMAGGVSEFAKRKEIVIIREGSAAAGRSGVKPATFRFNYDDVQKLRNLSSNIELRPGDLVIVP
jgi:polysaccharide export outer membrane protein